MAAVRGRVQVEHVGEPRQHDGATVPLGPSPASRPTRSLGTHAHDPLDGASRQRERLPSRLGQPGAEPYMDVAKAHGRAPGADLDAKSRRLAAAWQQLPGGSARGSRTAIGWRQTSALGTAMAALPSSEPRHARRDADGWSRETGRVAQPRQPERPCRALSRKVLTGPTGQSLPKRSQLS